MSNGNDSNQNELKLRTEIHKLDTQLAITKWALVLGWIPFALLAFVLMLVSLTAIAIEGSSLVGDASFAIFMTIVLFVALILGLVLFYAFVFRRRTSLSAELSLTKAKLEMRTGGDDS